MQKNIWILGGDARQGHLAALLAAQGHEVTVFALGTREWGAQVKKSDTLAQIKQAEIIIFPPVMADENGYLHAPQAEEKVPLEEIFTHMVPHQIIFGTHTDVHAAALAQKRGITMHSYLAREEFVIENAVITAEGCIQYAMEHLPITLHQCRTLVIGFGRVGSVTAQRFSALGAEVTVAARRKSQHAWARAQGFDALDIHALRGWLYPFDLIINTVPAPILGKVQLESVREDCLIIDLASRPGGIDRDAAAQMGRKVIWALGLPGKVAPHSAAYAMKRAILGALEEIQQ